VYRRTVLVIQLRVTPEVRPSKELMNALSELGNTWDGSLFLIKDSSQEQNLLKVWYAKGIWTEKSSEYQNSVHIEIFLAINSHAVKVSSHKYIRTKTLL
jgi:hypothetical protein